ncbi:MAG: carboxypeptidase regulatory-like domain-containing protein, partial [Vicinamibacterales bacterium]
MRQRLLSVALVIGGVVGSLGLLASAQTPVRGTLSGTVTTDKGQVVGFRVAAHNLDRRIWYTVFTNKGRYTIPQALPGRYEVMVNEPDFESSTVAVQLGPGDSRTANMTLKQKGGQASLAADEMLPANRRGNTAKKIVYVDSMEEIFPSEPGQELVKALCTGCHRDGGTWRNAQTYDEFLKGIERMTETGPAGFPNVLALGRTPLSARDKALIANYLTKHFGPGMPDKRLRIDPLVVDEDVASKAIYVGYDIPEDLPLEPTQGRRVGAPMIDGEFPQLPGLALHHLQAAALAPDGGVWFSSRVSNSVIRLDPKQQNPATRWKDYPIKGDRWVAVSGMAADSKGKIYWSELKGGMLGELDPATGKQIRYVIPQQGVDVGITVDKDDNVGFALIWGALFGRLDAKTRTIHTYPTPTPDNGIYG